MADTMNGHEIIENSTVAVSVGSIAVGDVVTIPGTSVHQCRVQIVRSAVPGVVWLYLTDPTTGHRIRGHVALPINRSVLRHSTTPAAESDQTPDDS